MKETLKQIKNYKFIETARVICLDETMIDLKDISAIHVKDYIDGNYKVQILLKSKGYINVTLSVGIKDALQADFLRERKRRVDAAEFNHQKTIEKELNKNKNKPKGRLATFNVWWQGK